MSWLIDLFSRGARGEIVKITKVKASRATYLSADLRERIELHLEVEGGHKLVLDLSSEQARKLLQEVGASYEAIHPPLRPDLRGTWN